PSVTLGLPRPGSSLPLVRAPLPGSELADAATATGFDVTTTAPDSNPETVVLAAEIPTGGRPSLHTTAVIPSASLVAWLRATGRRGEIRLGAHSVTVGGIKIPTESDSELRVHFVAPLLPGGSQVLSALDLVEGRAPLTRLRGKTVVFGVDDPSVAKAVAAPVGSNRHLAPAY